LCPFAPVCGKPIAVSLEKLSPCKVNLLLNILGRRADGFHELETVLQPIRVFDRLTFARTARGIGLSCSAPGLPTDGRNLVVRAAAMFLEAAGIKDGVRMELEKNIPLAAGLGGGSGNAATTLLGLNELFGEPLTPTQLQVIATALGSDVPFFLQGQPALATGRGERIEPLEPFPALRGAAFVLIHPGFGIATAWAYQQLARFPHALNGRPGRAQQLISLLQSADLATAGAATQPPRCSG
jgi:4-diphosphocytidyl-2-C-methyl-D-erythritol kinase